MSRSCNLLRVVITNLEPFYSSNCFFQSLITYSWSFLFTHSPTLLSKLISLVYLIFHLLRILVWISPSLLGENFRGCLRSRHYQHTVVIFPHLNNSYLRYHLLDLIILNNLYYHLKIHQPLDSFLMTHILAFLRQSLLQAEA